ncbi:T9SS type A sorting domain-containing protein [Aureispira anguillae]|nr:T9SS type A sorting domain-containing protein [Aureispira anguillae]
MNKLYFWCILLCLCNNHLLQAQCTSDSLPPTVFCRNQPLAVYLNNTGTKWVRASRIDAGSVDNCGIQRYTINGQDSLLVDCSVVGLTAQTVLRVFDYAGNSATCATQIQVRDTLAPLVSCQNITTYLDSTGLVTVVPDDIDFYSMDNCQIASKLIDGQQSIQFNCDSIASSPHVASLTVIDNHGRQNSCRAVISIVDNIPPIASCLNTITVYVDSLGQGTVAASDFDAGSVDNCGNNNLFFHINGDSVWNYNCSKIGLNNTVNLTIGDANGNMVNCATQIQVLDTIPPVVQCKPVEVYLATTGNAAVSAADIDDLSTDNCAITARTFLNGNYIKNYSCVDVGVDSVYLLIRDPSGNTGTCATTVTIRDSIKPTIVCNAANVNLTGNSLWILTPADVGVAYDNCTIDTSYLTPSVFTCQDIGTVTYTLTVEDANGNWNTCLNTVHIFADTPTIVTPTYDSLWHCTGDTLNMEGILPNNGLVYQADWIGPLGTISSGPISGQIDSLTFAHTGNYYFTIVPNNGQGCPMTDSFYLEIDSCLLANQHQAFTSPKEPILIFPNPTTGTLTVTTLGDPIQQVVIYNLAGQVVFYNDWERAATDDYEIDCSSLPTGMYIVYIQSEQARVAKRIQIEH